MQTNTEDEDFIVYFSGTGGYPHERETASKAFMEGVGYRVIGGRVGSSRTALRIEGIHGEWNSCLFRQENGDPVDIEHPVLTPYRSTYNPEF